MRALFVRLLRCERGATALEYALLGALIGAAMIAAVGALGSSLQMTFDRVHDATSGQVGAGR